MGMKTKPSSRARAKKAIAILGGPSRAARVLDVSGHQTIQSWIKNRVPAEYCPLIERETAALGSTVFCEEMRPDIAWEVLRLQAGPGEAEKAGA